MNLSHWFHDQLQASASGFIWAAQRVPSERRFLRPPEGLGEWSAARHIFHMMFYEQKFALPSMKQWLGEQRPSREGVDEDVAWAEGKDNVDVLIAEFKQVRNNQVALLPMFDDSAWNMSRETNWGLKTLAWVVSKTYQHTAEHTSDIMQIVLFWDDFEEWKKSK